MANITATALPFYVLIPAAGKGQRMGSDTPKQYMNIAGKPLLRHTLDNVLSWDGVQNVHVIIHPDHREYYAETVKGLDLPPPIIGGNERSDSVFNGLKEIQKHNTLTNDDIILIHDGARPFTHPDDIRKFIAELTKSRAASLSSNISDTIRKLNENDVAGDVIDRNILRGLQTPQGFRYSDILKAHEQNTDNVTDDTSLISIMGIDVTLVTAEHLNMKITTPEDLIVAKTLLSKEIDIRTGMGFDVHAFVDTPTGRPLMLCGVSVEHERALSGHSDADVGLHALTDAIFGAIGEGDIGRHFPPSDDTFKDMDSAVFLDKAVRMCRDKGGIIMNTDLTLICERPKITPYAAAMRTRVATLLNIDESRVNIKATTTEKLGFTGRGEGIAAQAVISIRV